MGEIIDFKKAKAKIHEERTNNYSGNPKFKPTPVIQRPGAKPYSDIDFPITDEQWELTHRELAPEEKQYIDESKSDEIIERVESKIRH